MGGGHGEATYDLMYYVKAALSGGICCSITHGALCPVDVVKTRIQLDPIKYSGGMIKTFRTIVAEEGAGVLATGVTATAVGYFVQGCVRDCRERCIPRGRQEIRALPRKPAR